MNTDLELLSIGDASLDVFLFPSETESLCELRTHETKVCFDYGDKIPVRDLKTSIGGNAANNAVGTRRLGIKSGALITLGDDDIGEQILRKLQKENVSCDFVTRQSKTRSNLSTIINYGGERTIFSYKEPRDYEFPRELPSVPWGYLTSLGDAFPPFYQQVVDWVSTNQIKLAFNPGSRQIRSGIESLKNVLAVCEILYLNRQEGEKLTGLTNTKDNEKELLKALSQLGPKISIVTDGSVGAFLYDGQTFLRSGVLPIDAYERTGAGDSFGSGCIAALIKGFSLSEALLWGTINSASVIGFIGSQEGLLTEADLPVWIDRAKSCNLAIEEF